MKIRRGVTFFHHCRQRISCRYVLSFIGLFALVAFVFTLLTLWLARTAIEQVQVAHQHDLARVIARDQRLVKNGQIDMAAIKRVFYRYMVLNPSLELYLLDPSGKVLLYSADLSRIKRSWVDPRPVLQALSHPDPKHWPLGDDPRALEGKRPFSAAWLPSPQQREKILYVVLSAGHADQVNRYLQESVLLKMAFWGAGIALGIGLLVGAFMFRPLVKRLDQMETWVSRFQIEQPETLPQCHMASADEIDHLARALCRFMHTLQQQWQQLTALQTARNQLIRGLAHDLKTPLTALQGYLELAAETRHPAYLRKAYHQGEKLAQLLNQLLTFARMEQAQVNLKRQPTSLAPWLQQQVMHYQELHPHFHWQFSAACHPECEVDVGLLERAFNNLFDNIVAHSQANKVHCSVHCPQPGQVVIRICDNGQGVPQDMLKQLPEAGFRVARHRQGSHAGLGLSIVEMIMAHHGGRLVLKPHQPQGLCVELHFPQCRLSEEKGGQDEHANHLT